MSDGAAAALSFARETYARCADQVTEHPLGTVLRTPSLNEVWSLNAILVSDPPPGLDLATLEQAFDEHLAGARFASASLYDDAAAAPIEAAARERGWIVEHELFMVLTGEPERREGLPEVRVGTEDEARPLMEMWIRQDFAKQGEGALLEVLEYGAREWRARPGATVLVAGDARATCVVWGEDGVAQVENVFTAPDARGRGYARALVTHAIDVARRLDPEVIFIVADDDNTPKELYARLGFSPAVRLTRVVRERA